MINVTTAINSHYPNLDRKITKPIFNSLVFTLNKLFHVEEINSFIGENYDLENFEFIEKVFEHLEIDYTVSSNEKQNIPSSGRVIIIANHPLGALDSLALLKLIGEVRKDVKIVANDVLMQLSQLSSLLLPVNNMTNKTTGANVRLIHEALNNEEAVIIFPAGEVSRARPSGVKDVSWNSGFLRFASKTKSPILPVSINAKNSFTFYSVSSVFKPASTLLLPHEMFKKRRSVLNLKVGEIIPFVILEQNNSITRKTKTKLLKKHLERIGKGKKGIFKTSKSIAHPESRQELKAELKMHKFLELQKIKRLFIYAIIKKILVL